MFYMLLALATGGWSLRVAGRRARWVREQDPGTERMREIARATQAGAMAFLSREYRALGLFVGVVTAVLFVGGLLSQDSSFLVAVSFVVGAGCAAMAGYSGLRVATDADVRTANAARSGLAAALHVAFAGGAVSGLVVAGLAVCGLTTLFLVYAVLFGDATMRELHTVTNVLAGFALGASSIALFARVGGGIVAAVVAAADPPDSAMIADWVAEDVGAVAGQGADLFDSFIGSIVAAMVLGVAYDTRSLVILPIILAAIGIIASIVGMRLVRIEEGGDPTRALTLACIAAGGLMLALAYPVATMVVPGVVEPVANVTGALHVLTAPGIFMAMASGLLAGIAIGLATEFYTAAHSETGATVTGGLALGMVSTAWPVVFLVGAIVVAFFFAGLYGIAIASVGMLSTIGIQLAVVAFAPIVANAGGVAAVSDLDPETRARTDRLAAVGKITGAVGKGFAIGSAALTALALFAAFRTVAGVHSVDVGDPVVTGGLLFGGMLPFLFSALVWRAVGAADADTVEAVRQFRATPGPEVRTDHADRVQRVDLAAGAAMRRMMAPGFLALATPVIVGLLDVHALAGLLAGVIVAGVPLAIAMTNAESRALAGKRVSADAVVVADPVRDSFRDAAGPSLTVLIKVMAVVALVMATLLA